MRILRALISAAVVWTLIPVSSAVAQPKGFGGNERIVISGPVRVAAGEVVDDVIVFHGLADVAGMVDGDLVVIDGPVEVSGTVEGNLVAFRGPVTLRDTAEIRGDVVVSGELTRAPGAEVAGETKEAGVGEFPGRMDLFGRIAGWIAFTVSMVLIGLLLLVLGPRVTEGLARTGLSQTGPAFAWGLVAFLGIPVATLISFVTLVGIPLGIMLLFGMLFLYPVAYASSALVLGRRLIPEPGRRFVSLLAGLAILRLLAFVPVVGGLTWFLATVFGLGVMAMAVGKARAAPAETLPPTATTPEQTTAPA